MVDSWCYPSSLSSESFNSKSMNLVFNELKSRVDLSEKPEWTPLHCAAFLACARTIKILLKNGADVNKTTNHGKTPLHLACLTECRECIQIILEYHPNLNKQDIFQDTPLNLFIKWYLQNDQLELLKRFLYLGADPNIADREGNSPLINLANISTNCPIVKSNIGKLLINWDGDVNARNKYGTTALHKAVLLYCESFVKVLLDNGASVDTRNISNDTPISLAIATRFWNREALETLGEHIILQYCCKIPVDKKTLEYICDISQYLQNFKNRCDYELLNLYSKCLGQSNLTFLDILVSHPYQIAKYLRNSDVSTAFHNFELWDTIFGNKLLFKYFSGLRRYQAENIGFKFFEAIHPPIPVLCVDYIIQFLSDVDLNNLKDIIIDI